MNFYYPEGRLFSSPENLKTISSDKLMKEAYLNGRILEATGLRCSPAHDMLVDIPDARAVIPREEGALGIAEGTTRDIALLSRVSKPVCFIIDKITEDENGLSYILSRAGAQRRCMDEYISSLSKGDVIPARVTHLEPFGAFVDIGCGIPSLIPIDAISVSRISHPSDRFYNGQNIFAIVKDFRDPENGSDRLVCLSHKELLGTWEENCANFEVGSVVPGIVRSIESYGIFIEIAPNLAGLSEPCEGITPGMGVSVSIKAMRAEKMKLKLAIVDVSGRAGISPPMDYYITCGNIRRWVYSPDNCVKTVESVFE